MSQTVFRRDSCRMCNGEENDLVLEFVPTPVGDGFIPANRLNEPQETYPLDLFLCRNCGNLQLLSVVDAEILYRNYVYVSSVSLGMPEYFREYGEHVAQKGGLSKDSFIVELGSNEGWVLRYLKERGMHVLGVDPAVEIAKTATESGIETLPTFFTEELAQTIKRDYGPADMIIANNVAANIDDLSDMAKGICHLLKPDGVFMFESSYLLDVYEKTLIDTIFHEHLCYFAAKPLKAFFDRHGMELIHVQRVSPRGGSIRGMAQPKGGPRSASPSVAELISVEEKAGLYRLEAYQTYNDRIQVVKNDLLSLLNKLKAEGKTIGAYGAAVGLTTLIYHFELGDLLTFIVDDNPSKQDTFSPGFHIPVYPSQVLYEHRPDYILILAWRYAEPIMKKHSKYAEQGGRFILPLPEVKVV